MLTNYQYGNNTHGVNIAIGHHPQPLHIFGINFPLVHFNIIIPNPLQSDNFPSDILHAHLVSSNVTCSFIISPRIWTPYEH